MSSTRSRIKSVVAGALSPRRRRLRSVVIAFSVAAAAVVAWSAPAAATGPAAGPNATTTTWTPAEVSFESTQTYLHPFADIDVSAVITNTATGGSMTMPMFWDGQAADGNQVWRLRFAPPVVGSWTYVTSSSDGNPDLYKTGTITATAYAGRLPVYQHGSPPSR